MTQETQPIEALKEEIIDKVEELADGENVSANATAEVAVTAAAIIVGDTRDDIRDLEIADQTQDDKISWLMNRVESLTAEVESLRSSSIQTAQIAEAAQDDATAAVAIAVEALPPQESSTPNPSPEIPPPSSETNPPHTDTTTTEVLPASEAVNPEAAEPAAEILAPLNQALQRSVIIL